MDEELEVKKLDSRWLIMAPLGRQIYIVGTRKTPMGIEKTEVIPVMVPEERFVKILESLKEALFKKKAEELVK